MTKGVSMTAASLVQCLSLSAGLRRACSTGRLPCIAFTDSAKCVTTCDSQTQLSLLQVKQNHMVIHLFLQDPAHVSQHVQSAEHDRFPTTYGAVSRDMHVMTCIGLERGSRVHLGWVRVKWGCE